MTESSDVQALAKISTEVDESQIKTILSSQCIKAQILLVNKLRKQTKGHKEVCNFMSSANLKLESEINLAEKEIITLRLCQQTMKNANIELKKELLLAKESKSDIIQRMKDGEKKYEGLWLECKSRFESIPYVKKLLQAQEKVKEVQNNIEDLQKEAEKLSREIVVKKNAVAHLDRQRIVELAKYLVEDRPNDIKLIQEMNAKITELTKEINEMNNGIIPNSSKLPDESKLNNSKQDNTPKESPTGVEYDLLGPLMIPKIQKGIYTLDSIAMKLDQFKNTVIEGNTSELPVPSTSQNQSGTSLWNRENRTQCFYSFFDKPTNMKRKHENYSKNKIINIIEDVKIDKDDALDLISKVVPEKLQTIHSIVPIINQNNQYEESDIDKECKIIEVTDPVQDLLIPPTQFSDGKNPEVSECIVEEEQISEVKASKQRRENDNQEHYSIQAEVNEDSKKKVTFNLTPEGNIDVDGNETINSQLDTSIVSEEDYAKIKDMIFKKHNLDLSPQFVYTKNTAMLNTEKVVTSKFFENNECRTNNVDVLDNTISKTIKEGTDEAKGEDTPIINIENNSEINENKADEVIEINSQKTSDNQQYPVKGFLFSHGPNDIPDSLDVSISTTGFEEGDSEFPHCIDSSLLLSPKANLPMSACENTEPQSQEVPNFLTGLRKAGLSFFGGSTQPKGDENVNVQNTNEGFSFNFSGEDKKNRGGLFSMFHS